jgi:hypothetical protein
MIFRRIAHKPPVKRLVFCRQIAPPTFVEQCVDTRLTQTLFDRLPSCLKVCLERIFVESASFPGKKPGRLKAPNKGFERTAPKPLGNGLNIGVFYANLK